MALKLEQVGRVFGYIISVVTDDMGTHVIARDYVTIKLLPCRSHEIAMMKARKMVAGNYVDIENWDKPSDTVLTLFPGIVSNRKK